MAGVGTSPANGNGAEKDYWANVRELDAEEDRRIEAEFAQKADAVRLNLSELYGEQDRLETRLATVQQDLKRDEALLDRMYAEHETHKRQIAAERDAQAAHMRQYFSGQNAPGSAGTALPTASRRASTDPEGDTEMKDDIGHTKRGPQQHAGPRSLTGANLTDSEGRVIGPLKTTDRTNRLIEVLLDRDIKRHIVIRQGLPFSEADLESIYERTDAKCTKWVAAMVQATGEIQSKRCAYCSKNAGIFEECVFVPGAESLFPRCGNCEWDRQPCMGAALPNSETIGGGLAEEDVDMRRESTGSLSARGKSGPPAESPDEEEDDDALLVDINKATLLLRHDGTTYTAPDCMVGVPVAKIDESHPYWDSTWTDVKRLIEPLLDKWKDKYDAAVAAGAVNHSKYQIGRQVNRGQAILKYLETGEISPYQLIAKKYITNTLVSYDTVFRMVHSLEELQKFHLDVTPLEWMRQRLHELILEQGENFKLAHTIHEFYRDEKLSALRRKNGYGNIGRPSGSRVARTASGQRGTPGGAKRKSAPNTPAGSPSSNVWLAANGVSAPDFRQAKKPKAGGILWKEESEPDLDVEGFTDRDSYCGDMVHQTDWRIHQVKTRLYTSNDEVTQYWHWVSDGDPLFEHQVLTEMSPNVQWGLYEESIDFHIYPSEVEEVRWSSATRKIIVVMSDGAAIAKQDGLPRGNVLAKFKRERTKRRFLVFCRKKGIKLQRYPMEEIEFAWDQMQSEPLAKESEQLTE